MKYILAVLILSLNCIAQTIPSNPPTTANPPDPFEGAWNVAINGSYSNIANAATNNGFTTTEAVRVAQHWNLRSDQFITLNPSTVIVLAKGEYRMNLGHFLSKSNYIVNASKFEAFANAGLGTARSSTIATDGSSTLSAAKFAWGVGGGFDVALNSTMSLRPLDITYVRAGMLQNGGTVLGNHLSFAAGLGIRF